MHCFIKREDTEPPLVDYQMTRVTFGTSTSLFAANMALIQNALENVNTHPQVGQVVLDSFNVDNELIGAYTIKEAI